MVVVVFVVVVVGGFAVVRGLGGPWVEGCLGLDIGCNVVQEAYRG